MQRDKPRDEHPLAEVAFQLGKLFPTIPLFNVIAAVRQADEELVNTGDMARVMERARLILRLGQQQLN